MPTRRRYTAELGPFLSGEHSVSNHASRKLLYHELVHLFDLAIAGDTAAELSALRTIIRRYGNGGDTLLDIGCGIGRHAGPLAKAGFRVTGIDSSEHMVARARALHPDCTFLQEDFRSLNLGRDFDAAIMMWTTLNYTDSPESAADVFRRVRMCLNDNGLFIIDVKNFEQLDRPTSYTRSTADDMRRVDLTVEKELVGYLNVATYHYTVTNRHTGDITEFIDQEIARQISLPDIRAAAGSHFAVRASFGDFGLSPLHPKRSPRLVCVLQALQSPRRG